MSHRLLPQGTHPTYNAGMQLTHVIPALTREGKDAAELELLYVRKTTRTAAPFYKNIIVQTVFIFPDRVVRQKDQETQKKMLASVSLL